MTVFGHDAPGVEWNPATTEATMPQRTSPAAPAPYPPACPACGGELGVDGYCLTCGQKAPSLRDHYDLAPAPWLAGVCDIGRLHARNEDALVCQADAARGVIVVCDGVTTSDEADAASLTAARCAADFLWANDPQGVGTPRSRTAAVHTMIAQAVKAANQAVVDQTDPASQNSAATTIALALIEAGAAHCANLGDSRVYWLPSAGEPRQVTRDHSLAQDGMDSGAGRAEAESSIFAHTITRWLGRDAVDLTPCLVTVRIETPGWLIVCSDGLWNYTSEAVALKELVDRLGGDEVSPLDLANRLVAWANDQGGHDNVTVACARLGDPARSAGAAGGVGAPATQAAPTV